MYDTAQISLRKCPNKTAYYYQGLYFYCLHDWHNNSLSGQLHTHLLCYKSTCSCILLNCCEAMSFILMKTLQNSYCNASRVFLTQIIFNIITLTLLLLSTTCPVLANSVDPDQLASEEANWSGSALFVIKFVNFYQKPRSSNLIGWKLEVGVVS